jgi:AcrR family transcriptional regulator
MAAPALIDRSAPFAPFGPRSAGSLEQRIVEAMLDCIGRWGIAKTTADDIARAAGISRATLYRAFPGGKDVAFEALLRHETARFFTVVTERLDSAHTVEDLLVIGIVEAARFLTHHQALGYLLAHEPERVLPAFAFHRLDRALAVATAFTAPHLRRVAPDDDTAARQAEWIVRILLSYAVNPSPTLDLTDDASVRRFVATYLMPALAPQPTTSSVTSPANAPKER